MPPRMVNTPSGPALASWPDIDYSPGIGSVAIWSHELAVIVGLGDGPPAITQGVGGWEEIERSRRKSITSWKGRQPLAITFPVLFDTLHDESKGYLLERQIRALEKMAGMLTTGEPPTVQFDSGGLIPHDNHDHPGKRWVINGLEEGDSIRNSRANRIRQAFKVTVLEYVEDVHLDELPAHKRRRAAATGKPKGAKHPRKHEKVTTKKGDNLIKISKDEYGTPYCWKAIAHANPKKKLRDGRKELKAGLVLRMP